MKPRYFLKTCFQVFVLCAAVFLSIASMDPVPTEYTATTEVYEYDPVADTWTRKARMPRPKYAPVCEECSGLVYMIGGTAGTYGNRDKRYVDAYDPALDSWSRCTDVTCSVREALSAHCSVAGRIYIFGSYLRGNQDILQMPRVLEYDPAADAWTDKADMPDMQPGGKCFVIGAQAYVAFVKDPSACSYWQYRDPFMLKYDPAGDDWSPCADPPASGPLVEAGGKIYIVGGLDPATYTYLDSLYEYDPAGDAWTARSSKPSVNWAEVLVVSGGRIYAFCDKDLPVEEYDPSSNTWAVKSDVPVTLGGARHYSNRYGVPFSKGIALNNMIYLFSMRWDVAEYDPAADTWAMKTPEPRLHLSGTADYVVSGGRIYVIGGYADTGPYK